MLCDYLLITAFPHTKTLLLGRLLPAGGGIVVVALLFLILYFYRAFYDSRREEELTKLEKTRQREYFSKLLKREEETRRFRHDILNDLLELQNYCNHKNYEQMENYLERMLGTVEEISHSTYDVGNDIVNTVINYYFQPLRKHCHIEVSGYMSEKSSIEERDLCVLSANLMKNAAERAGKMKDGEIKVSIKEGKKYLCLQVKNSFEGEVYFDKKGLPITTKPDKRNHGIGTRNIAEVVEKNGGTYQAEAKDGMYAVEIYLKL
jgi:sensor histidine kinase regulating citrate/malate metabolism